MTEETRATTFQPNPLFLYPVLNVILKKTSFKSLLVMRLVCKSWSIESTRFILRNSKIIVNGNQNLEKLADIVSTSFGFPSVRFTFNNSHLDNLRLILRRSPNTTFANQIKAMNITGCIWTSVDLRKIIFEYLPNLQTLKVELDYDEVDNSNNSLPVLPMSFGIQHKLLTKLKSFHLIGDFSRKSDVVFDILKQSPNLELIQLNKVNRDQDDLFGTWFFEIVMSMSFQKLGSLEIECSLIPMQVESLLDSSATFPLKRICLNLTQVSHSLVFDLLKKFKRTLQCAEFQLLNPPEDLVQTISTRFPNSQVWVAIHSNPFSKFIFPLHYPNIKLD